MSTHRRNHLLTFAWIMTLLATLNNFVFFWQFAGESIFPWLGLALFAAALLFCALALRRAFGQPVAYRGKRSGAIVTALACLMLTFTLYAFYEARRIPDAGEAPRVGEKAPEFALADTSGAVVTLSGLLSAPLTGSPRPDGKPKAVLLVFYRGYW